jgi:hypothetical protein
LLESGFEEIEKRLDKLDEEVKTDETQKKESLRLLRGYWEKNKARLCYRERWEQGRVIGSPSGARGQKCRGQVEQV